MGFCEVGDDEFGVFEDFVGVGQDGVELNGFARFEGVFFVAEGDVDAAAADPADFVFVAVGFGVLEGGAGFGGGVEEVDALPRELFEVEGTGLVALDLFDVSGSGFREGKEVGGGEAEDSGDAEKSVNSDHGLVALELGEARDGEFRALREFVERHASLFADISEDGEIDGRTFRHGKFRRSLLTGMGKGKEKSFTVKE